MAAASSADFWTTEAEWQTAKLADDIAANVVKPKQVSGGMFAKSYTTYCVTSTPCDAGVWRRYSDFEFLRDILVSRFHGVAVPMLPDKRVVGNLDDEFIERRRSQLADWVRKVASNPYLRSDATFLEFLTASGDADWQQKKKAASAGEGSDPTKNEGLLRWFGCLCRYPLPEDADAAVGEAGALNEAVAVHANALLKAFGAHFEATKHTIAALNAVTSSFKDLSAAAVGASEKLGSVLATTKEQGVALGDLTAKAKNSWEKAASIASYADNEIQLFLMGAVASEISRCQAFRALLQVRHAAQEAYGRSSQALNQLRFRHKQAQDKGDAARAVTYEPQIAEAEKQFKNMKARLDDVTKGILLVEAKAVSTKRVQMLSQLFGCFAAAQVASATSTQTVWMSFLAETSQEKDATIAKTQRMLDDRINMDEYVAILPSAPDTGFAVAAAPAPAAAAAAASAAGAAASGAAAPAFGGSMADTAAPEPAPAPAPAPVPAPAPAPADSFEAATTGNPFGDDAAAPAPAAAAGGDDDSDPFAFGGGSGGGDAAGGEEGDML